MTTKNYVIGFVLSVLLTLFAYNLVVGQMLTGLALLLVIGGLALTQLVVQLIYFLHLPDELAPRYKLLSFGFMVTVLLIVVAGSLWIMHHMNYNMMDMSADQKDQYMTSQKDKGF